MSDIPQPPTFQFNDSDLRRILVYSFNTDELQLLCRDIEQDLINDGIHHVKVDLDMIKGDGKEIRCQNLIDYLTRRKLRKYLVNALWRERRDVLTELHPPLQTPPADPSPSLDPDSGDRLTDSTTYTVTGNPPSSASSRPTPIENKDTIFLSPPPDPDPSNGSTNPATVTVTGNSPSSVSPRPTPIENVLNTSGTDGPQPDLKTQIHSHTSTQSTSTATITKGNGPTPSPQQLPPAIPWWNLQNRRFWPIIISLLLIPILTAGGIIVAILDSIGSHPNTPQTPAAQAITCTGVSIGICTVNTDVGPIITGINTANNSFFTTPQQLSQLKGKQPASADGEKCIVDANSKIAGSSYMTVVVPTTLSRPLHDDGEALGVGNDSLQGLCLKQMAYNVSASTKVRIFVANLGNRDPGVLAQTTPVVTQQIIALAKSDLTLAGVIGFPISGSLYDPSHNIDSMKVLQSAGIPVISPTASSEDFSDQWPGYFFRANPGDKVQGQVAVNFAQTQLHSHTADVFFDPTNPYTKSLGTAFLDSFPGAKPEVFDLGQTEKLKNDVADMIQNPPDMLYCACYAADFSALYAEIQNQIGQGHTALSKIILMGGNALYDLQGSERVYKSMYITAFTFPDTIQHLCSSNPSCTSEQTGFYAAYCQQFAPDIYKRDPANYSANCNSYGSSRPSKDVMLSYDALGMLLQAYQNKTSNSQRLYDQIRLALPHVNFEGITGRIQMSTTSSDPINKMLLVIQVDNNGFGGVVAYYGQFT